MKTLKAKDIIELLSGYSAEKLSKISILGNDNGSRWRASYVWDDTNPVELFCDLHKSITAKKLLAAAKSVDPETDFAMRFGDAGRLMAIKVGDKSGSFIYFDVAGEYSSIDESLFQEIYNKATKLKEANE